MLTKRLTGMMGTAVGLAAIALPGLVRGQSIYTPYTSTTLAGLAGNIGSADGTGSAARFYYPRGVAVDSSGNVYVADTLNHTVRKITPAGVVLTLAGLALDGDGNGEPDPGYADGTGGDARFNYPRGVAVDSAGNIYVADSGNNLIRKITSSGLVTTLAGSTNDFDGDGWPDPGSADGTGSDAQFWHPCGVAVDGGGNVYVADTDNHTIRKITPAGEVTTLAGLPGEYGSADGTGSDARFWFPDGVAVDAAGNVYVADTSNTTIRQITPAGVVTTLAGLAGTPGFADGTGSGARFDGANGVAVDGAGNVYVADTHNNYTIRQITPGGVVTTLAGLPGAPGSADGTGSDARFGWGCGVAADSTDNVYVAGASSHTLRKLTPACVCVVTNEAQTFGVLGSARDTNGWVTLTWETCSDHLYEVQTTEELSAETVWTAWALMIGADPVTVWTDTNAPAGAHRFYRVRRLGFTGDEDADGYTNLQEYRAGTALHDAASHPTNFPPNVSGWWKLDEEGGFCILDSSPYGHHGLLSEGMPWPSAGAAERTMGVMSRAVGFGGYYWGRIEVPYDPSLPPAQAGTLTGWINPTSPDWDSINRRGNFYGIVAMGSNFNLAVCQGKITATLPQNQVETDQLVTPKQWHLLGMTYSPTNFAVFLDNRCLTNASASIQGLVPSTLVIGGRPPNYSIEQSSYRLDDVRIYSRSLDLAEIQSLYNEDSDGDGIPNWWMSTCLGHGTGESSDATLATDDYDGDGYSNVQEYQWRTRPDASYNRPAQVPRNLAAWWKLDEGGGTSVIDSSLNGHHGMVMGVNPAGAWTTGVLSNAVTLGGPSNNWIQVPYHPSLISTQQFTLAGWVKPFGQGILIGNWDSVGQVYGNYRLQFGPDNIELRFSRAGDGSYETLQFNPNWTTNEWHHLAAWYSGTNVAVFVDGDLMASQGVAGSLVRAEYPIAIGFPGVTGASAVDDVRIYNRALGTNEIASLSRGNGLPADMIVGQTASLRAFGASESCTCQWSVVSGAAFFTNTASSTTDFRPSWNGAVTVQVACDCSGALRTNLSSAAVAFPGLSPIAGWNGQPQVMRNNCYSYATDIRTDSYAQPGGALNASQCTCQDLTSLAVSDGLQPGVDLGDLCHTSGLPNGHIAALLIWPSTDFHWVRMEADGA